VRGLARAARKAGARLFEGSAATRVERSGGAWRIATAHGNLVADRVVIGTDGYTGPLWPKLDRTILTVQSIQVATRPLGHNLAARILPRGECVSETRKLAFYFRRDPAGRFLLGARGPTAEVDSDAMFAALGHSLGRLFPMIDRDAVEYRWSGRVALTPDELPHLHEPAPGLHVGLGYNGRGVAMATMMGRALAERAAGAPDADAAFPLTPMAPIPWHGLRQPLMALGIAYYRLKDRLGLAS
jgi:sarcosine oxidase